jgi:hypothetical protein
MEGIICLKVGCNDDIIYLVLRINDIRGGNAGEDGAI